MTPLRKAVQKIVDNWRDASSDEHPLEGVARQIIEDLERALRQNE